jgi:4-hydroxybenzoate polyprenyltransferase
LLSVVTLGLCYGSAPVLYGLYLSSQQGALLGLVLGCTWLLIKISSVALKDYKDIDGDKKLNKVTFAVKFGKKTTQLLSILCAALGYGFFLALLSISYIHNLAQLLSLLILAIFAIYIVVYRCKFFSKLSRAKAAKIFSNIILLSAVFELGAVLCLLTL